MEVAGEVRRPARDGDAAAGRGGAREEGCADLVRWRREGEAGCAEVQVREARAVCRKRRRRRRKGLHGCWWCALVGAVRWLSLWCRRGVFDGSADCCLALLALPVLRGWFSVFIFIILIKLRQRVRYILQLNHRAFLAEIKGMDMHGADEAREGDLLEFVVDKVADGVSEGEAGGSGGEGGPVDRDGHLHGFGDVGRGREGERGDWNMEIGYT